MSGSKKYLSAPVNSTAELAKMMRTEFENPDESFSPIVIKGENQAAKEIEYLSSKIAEGVDWNDQVDAIKRGAGLVNGGALDFESFASKISNLSVGLIAGSCNLRSTLVRFSCLFISLLAHKLKKRFNCMGEVIMPLSRQTTHGTLIIAESCKLTILEIVKYCPIKNVLFSVIELSKSKAVENRQVSAESFVLLLNYWAKTLIEQNSDIVMKTLRLLLVDSSAEVRNTTRIASKIFASKYPKFTELFLATLDSKTKAAVLAAEVPPETPPIKQDEGEFQQKQFEPASPIEPRVSGHLLLSPRSPKSFVEEVKQQEDKKPDPISPKMKFVQDIMLESPMPLRVNEPTPTKPTKLPAKTKSKQNQKEETKPSMIPIYDKTQDRSKSPALPPPKKRFNASAKHRASSVRNTRPKLDDLRRPKNKKDEVIDSDENIPTKEEHKTIKKTRKQEKTKPKQKEIKTEIKATKTEVKEREIEQKPQEDIVEKYSSPQKRRSEESMPPPRIVDGSSTRRSSNPMKKTNKRRSTISLEDGNERSFVDKISKALDEKRDDEVTSQLSTIIPGLLITMNSKSRLVSNRSIALITKLIPPNKNDFESFLQSIFDAFYSGILSDVIAKDNKDLLEAMFNVIKENYDPNVLLDLSLNQVPSVKLVKYISEFVLQTKLDSEEKAAKLAKITVSFFEQCREDARKILNFIAHSQKDALVEVLKECDQKQADFVKQVLEYVEKGYGEAPKLNENQDVDEMCQNIMTFAKNSDEQDYDRSMLKLYESMSDIVMKKQKEDADKMFQCMINIIELRGVKNFEPFASSALLYPDRNKCVNVLKLLDIIEYKAGSNKIISFLTNAIDTKNDVASMYVEELQRCIQMNTEMMRPQAKNMTKILCDHIDDENIYVRKSIIFCVAHIVKIYGEPAQKITKTLEVPKQRLIDIYVSKNYLIH